MKLYSEASLRKSIPYLYPLAVGVAVILVSVLVIIPQVQSILDGRQNVLVKKQELELVTTKKNLLASINKTQITSALAELDQAVPTEKEVVSVLSVLENLSLQTGIGLTSISLSPGVVSSQAAEVEEVNSPQAGTVVDRYGMQALTVKVQTTGSTAQFESFLAGLQSVRRLFDIALFSVTYNDDASDTVVADFSLLAYFLQPTSVGNDQLISLTADEQALLAEVSRYPNLNALLFVATDGASLRIGKANLFD